MALKSELIRNGMALNLADAVLGTAGSLGLTAAGSTVADASAPANSTVTFTTTASGTGTLLPRMEVGDQVFIGNLGANTLKVYPAESAAASGAAFNLGSADAVFSVATAKTLIVRKASALQYLAFLSA